MGVYTYNLYKIQNSETEFTFFGKQFNFKINQFQVSRGKI